MKRIIFMLLILFTLCSCNISNNSSDEVNSEPSNSQKVESIISKLSSDDTVYNDIFVNNTLGSFINNTNKYLSDYYKCVLNVCKFKSYNEFLGEITLAVPDFNKLVELACGDKNGFVSDYKNFLSIGLSDDEINEYIFDYMTKLINQGKYEISDYSFKLDDSFSTTGMINSSKDIESMLSNSVTTILNSLPELVDTGNESTLSNDMLQTLLIGDNYVLTNYTNSKEISNTDSETNEESIIKQKYILNITEIQENDVAIESLEQLSVTNNGLIIDKDTNIYLVKYTVKNISDTDMIMNNHFYLVTEDNKVYSYEGFKLSGILDRAIITPGETKELSSVLIGNTGRIVHYNSFNKIMYNINNKGE